ncbi:hypothetical protein BP6252_06853 [Coleophoma cylindrospora]|uniref:Uncharacterized protein n=1 Tax=Coleophoma cylindrospora TaxID=1849047 RepID=A0A3D8RG53_9HELO|nr:hypothetical protein BP6252_06853 [Coleophoma cylindrospora]
MSSSEGGGQEAGYQDIGDSRKARKSIVQGHPFDHCCLYREHHISHIGTPAPQIAPTRPRSGNSRCRSCRTTYAPPPRPCLVVDSEWLVLPSLASLSPRGGCRGGGEISEAARPFENPPNGIPRSSGLSPHTAEGVTEPLLEAATIKPVLADVADYRTADRADSSISARAVREIALLTATLAAADETRD